MQKHVRTVREYQIFQCQNITIHPPGYHYTSLINKPTMANIGQNPMVCIYTKCTNPAHLQRNSSNTNINHNLSIRIMAVLTIGGSKGCQGPARDQFTSKPSDLSYSSVEDLTGAQGRAPPSGPKFFQFHAVFGKMWQNRMLAPLGELAPPPRGNPGSATAHLISKIPASDVSQIQEEEKNFRCFKHQ